MKRILAKTLIAVALACLMAACGSSRKVVTSDNNKNSSSEEFILAELATTQLPSGTCTRALFDEAFSWKGTPYRAGGQSKKGTDCSGFVMEVFRKSLDIALPRSSAQQADACTSIKKDELKPGDLVFFRGTNNKGKISHVGLYVGDGRFIHASSSRGVMVSRIDERYYIERFSKAGRVPALASMLKKEKKKRR